LIHSLISSLLACSFLASVKFNLKLGLFNTLQNVPEEFEIVFCSMDRSEEEYNNFCSKMSWWCLPYAIATLPKLIMDYKAHGMPHLVIIDTDGKLITREGVQSLALDPVGKKFPWRRNRIVDILPSQYIMRKDGVNDVKYPLSFLDDKYLMLYFAARSDDLSKEFTPWLTKAYNILKGKRGDDFEVCRKIVCV
jgi:nucleoredoxin